MPHIHWVARQNKLEIPNDEEKKNLIAKAREAEAGRNTSTLVQPRSRIVQTTPVLDSPPRIPKNAPDRLAPPRASDPFSLPTRKGNSQPPNTISLFRLRRGNMTANADISNSPFNGLARSTRSTHVIVDGVSIPLLGSALLPGQNAPVSYLPNQRALAETADLTCDTPGHVFMHTRTATITDRTFTPPAIGNMLTIYSQMPLFRCAAFSSATNMQLYALDVGSTDGLVFSHFWQLTGVVWDYIYTAKQDDLRALHSCLLS